MWDRYKRFDAWGERVFFTDHPVFWGVLLCILVPPVGVVVLVAWACGRSDGKAWGEPWGDEGDPWEGTRAQGPKEDDKVRVRPPR